MYVKAQHFGDTKTAAQILADPDPAKLNLHGCKVGTTHNVATRGATAMCALQVANFKADEWAQMQFVVMRRVLFEKFHQNEHLKHMLLKTANRLLIDASSADVIWGAGLPAMDQKIFNRDNWLGQNMMGKALMHVRDSPNFNKLSLV